MYVHNKVTMHTLGCDLSKNKSMRRNFANLLSTSTVLCKCFPLVGTGHLVEVPEVWCHFLKSLIGLSISVLLWEMESQWLEITIFTGSGGTSLSGEAASSKLKEGA